MPEVRIPRLLDGILDEELFGDPKMLSFTSTPSIRNELSKAKPPEIVTCSVFGVLSVSPGASSATSCGVRPFGSALISVAL